MKDERLPPVVRGNPQIDMINRDLWRLPAPQNSDTIQRLQRVVIEIEKAAEVNNRGRR